MQILLDAAFPDGNQNYWKSTFLRAFSDAGFEMRPAVRILFASIRGSLSRPFAVLFPFSEPGRAGARPYR